METEELNWNEFRSSVKDQGFSQHQIQSMYKEQKRESIIDVLPNEMILTILMESDVKTALNLCKSNERLAKLCDANPRLWLKTKEFAEFKRKYGIECDVNYSTSHALVRAYYRAIMIAKSIFEQHNTYGSSPIRSSSLKKAFPNADFSDYDIADYVIYKEGTNILWLPYDEYEGRIKTKVPVFVCGLAYLLHHNKSIKLTKSIDIQPLQPLVKIKSPKQAKQAKQAKHAKPVKQVKTVQKGKGKLPRKK
jgi:hypothetical protein